MNTLQKIIDTVHEVDPDLEVLESTEDPNPDVEEYIVRSDSEWFILISYDTIEREAFAQLFSDEEEEVRLEGDLDNWVLPNLISVLERIT